MPTILIDADGCPVVDLTVRIGRSHGVPVKILCDTAHRIEREGAETLVFDKGADSVDFALVNRITPGDIVITQDYSLILTFVALFIFIGNLGRIEAFSGWLQNILAGHEVLVSVLASQVTSNVPAAILLSGFTDNFRALIIGTNLGGLGTLIASMASLISYRQIANEVPAEKGHYFAMFTISNVVFLAILMGAWALN